jgi:EAL domain-containing protein (putative c-di-GMP-specific phosphodiesterase class I)
VAPFSFNEFTVLCTDLDGEKEAFTIAERISAALAVPYEIEGAAMVLTASIGIALANGDSPTAQTIIRNADAAMYRAKEQGRARWLLFDEAIHRRAVQRLETEVELRRSLDEGDFRLHYQPVVHADGDLVGFEALVRWKHPTRGLVAPAGFIPLAEETGLVDRLGGWVLDEACRQARRWLDVAETPRPLLMSVNVSARQLRSMSVATQVLDALRSCALSPQDLCLEITESALIEDVDTTVEALEALHSIGVRLAVDDFGTGYTTLKNLKRFPIDIIKVDAGFVAGIGRDRGDAAITMAVIRLAHALGMTTVAEGVETEEQLELLRTLGCDMVQGYHLGPPVPASDALVRWGTPVGVGW